MESPEELEMEENGENSGKILGLRKPIFYSILIAAIVVIIVIVVIVVVVSSLV